MSGSDANKVQDLVKRIESFKKTQAWRGWRGRRRLKKINPDRVLGQIVRNTEGEVDTDLWNSLPEEERAKRQSELTRVLAELEAAAAQVQPCGYRAALVATSIFLPGAAAVLTVMIVLPEWPTQNSLGYSLAPVWGALGALAGWLLLTACCCRFADAKYAVPSSHDELLPRLDKLEASLRGFCPPVGSESNSCMNTAYQAAAMQQEEIRKDLNAKGLPWVLATGYSRVWSRLHRAEEDLIEFLPQKNVLESALYDEARLEGSDIPNRDELLAKLRKAIVSLDPSAHKYLKPTAVVTPPPALTIGTTTLPEAVVAAEYSHALLATGGAPPYRWAVTGGALPEGLILSTAGVLYGTPTSDGHARFTVQVTDSAGTGVEKYCELQISPQTQTAAPPLAFTSTPLLPRGTVDVYYAERLFAKGEKPPYTWQMKGTPIPGLDLSPSGVLQGTPTRPADYSFTVQVTDSTGQKQIERLFTLLITPPAATASVGATQAELDARGVLSEVRHSINEYRNARWNGLIVARNRLLATFMLTGMVVFGLLAIAIMSGVEKPAIIAATVFYLVGATVGLCNRLRSESQAESAVPDYGLSLARLITLPLFSGLGALGGLLLVAYLPFATPVLDEIARPATQRTEPNATSLPNTQNRAYLATEQKSPAAPKLENIFDLDKNLIGFLVAMVFGLAPGRLFDRLQQQADRYKADLKSSQSAEGPPKS